MASVFEEITALLQDREERHEDKIQRVLCMDTQKPITKMPKKEKQIMALAYRTPMPEHYKTVWTKPDLDELLDCLLSHDIIAVDTETLGVNPFMHDIVGISFYAPHRGFYIPIQHEHDINRNADMMEVCKERWGRGEKLELGVDYVQCLPREYIKERIKPLLEDSSKKFLFHNYRFDYHILNNWMGIKVGCYFDTMIAQWLLDENHSRALKDMAPTYLGVEADRYGSLFGKTTFDKVPILMDKASRVGALASYYAIKDTELTYRMYEFQDKHLNHPSLTNVKRLMYEIEMPFLHIVKEAEAAGVRFDADYMNNEVAPKMKAELQQMKDEIVAVTGDINLNSPAQLSKVLYEDLGLPRVNKKSPNSTDKKTLNKLKNHHPVIKNLLAYRAHTKLVEAFVDKLPEVALNGRIHCGFKTIGTVTGRLACANPNLCGAVVE